MIKKYILIIFASFIFGCSILSQSNSIDSSINTADRHIWVAPDENDLEQRRILQSRFDEIEHNIEVLFLKSEILDSEEINIRAGIKKFFPNIESMDATISGMINQEKTHVADLGQRLDSIRLNSKAVESKIAKLSKSITPDPVFSSKDYSDAFLHFKKGNYIKSKQLFKQTLISNPPYSVTDNILFGLAMSQYRLGNISKVSKPLSRLIFEYPDSEKWYMSHLVLALSLYKKREKSQALHILQNGLKKPPPHFIRSMFINLSELIQK
jgi:TolA-binding protein